MFTAVAFFLVFLPALQAQPAQDEPLESKYRIGVAVDQVFLPVTARSLEGGFYRGLTKEEFEVAEDGVLQDILNFHSESFPVHVVLLLDASGSTRSIQDQIHRAALKFVESLGPEDRVAVTAFNTQCHQVVSWTNQLKSIEAGLQNVKAEGHTALHDALTSAYDLLDTIDGRKAIVVLTDGADTGSETSRDELLRRAQSSEAMVYVISKLDQYWAEAFVARRVYTSRAEAIPKQLTDEYIAASNDFLYAISENTGGSVLNTAAYPNLSEIYKLIAEELKNQYYISYVPKNARRDGSWRSVDVRVSRPDVFLSNKRGYFAVKRP